jgi:hypothetical protein
MLTDRNHGFPTGILTLAHLLPHVTLHRFCSARAQAQLNFGSGPAHLLTLLTVPWWSQRPIPLQIVRARGPKNVTTAYFISCARQNFPQAFDDALLSELLSTPPHGRLDFALYFSGFRGTPSFYHGLVQPKIRFSFLVGFVVYIDFPFRHNNTNHLHTTTPPHLLPRTKRFLRRHIVKHEF